MRNPHAQRTSIFKLHGDISTPTHCILGKHQYDEAYGNDEIDMSLPIPKRLGYYYKNNSLLFLGSSLHNDRTVHVFRAIKEKMHDTGDTYIPQHFCIEQTPQTEEELTARNAYLAKLGITPIWFEPERYEYIESILRMARNELRYRQKPAEPTTLPEPTAKAACNLELEFNEFLRDFSDVLPLLYWLHRQVPQEATSHYLQALQRFFNSHTIFTETTDRQLVVGLDNLIRAFAMHPEIDSYAYGKLKVAFEEFQKFLQSLGGDIHSTTFEWDAHELLTLPLHQFEKLLEKPDGLSDQNRGVIRIIIAMLRHGKKQARSPKHFSQMPDALNVEFDNYMSICMSSKLGLSIPDHLSEELAEEIHILCEAAWKDNGTSNDRFSAVKTLCKRLFS